MPLDISASASQMWNGIEPESPQTRLQTLVSVHGR